MKTVIITGVAGFIGRQAAREFARQGWRVVGIDDRAPENAQIGAETLYHRMKLPSASFAELLKALKPEACVHCAGRASVPESMRDPGADFRDNVVLTFELLEAIREHARGCRFVFLSSAAVYGTPEMLPVCEDAPVQPMSPYGWHKRECEMLCEEYARLHDVPAVSARVFSAYGPGLRRQVIWDICERVLTSDALTLSGTGGETRDFIHVTDIARGLVLLAEKAPATGETFNLASGVETRIQDLAEMLIRALVRTTRPTFTGTNRPGDPLNWRADIVPITKLGFSPSMPIEQGLKQVATWAVAELGIL